MKTILGISAFYHDSAAALLKGDEIIAAAQEERFTRKKFDKRFPINAIRFCLKESNVRLRDVDAVVFYEKPLRKFKRLLTDFLIFAPNGLQQFLVAMPEWIKGKIFLDKEITNQLNSIDKQWRGELLFSEHHLSHAASAFYPSPFINAAVLVFDAVGEWSSTSIHIGENSNLFQLKEQHFPHSIGMLYSAFTYYIGFAVNSGEYKLMGLAPYGKPKYANLIFDHLVDLKEDGSFHLNLDYFDFCKGLRMTNSKFHKLFGGEPRIPETLITQKEMDVAASVQKVTEEIIMRIVRYTAKTTGQKNLCLAGGVALNCVANGKILNSRIFDGVWIQPAAGDAGGALGAALAAYYLHFKAPRFKESTDDKMRGAFLGPRCDEEDLEEFFIQSGAIYEKFDNELLLDQVAEDLTNGLIVGWCQGRMEFGPRALGNRSILGDPRNPHMQSKMNLKIKFRESFRPFAPSILEERLQDYFEMTIKSPYMLFVANVKNKLCHLMTEQEHSLFGIEKINVVRSDIPAVTHVDYSARIQSVSRHSNHIFYELLKKFELKTGCPVLINTSFNIRGEPIVCSVRDAFRCFMCTNIDVLVIRNYYLRKEQQNMSLKTNYQYSLEPD